MGSAKSYIIEDNCLESESLEKTRQYLLMQNEKYKENLLKEEKKLRELEDRITSVSLTIHNLKTNDDAILGVFSPVCESAVNVQLEEEEKRLFNLKEQKAEAEQIIHQLKEEYDSLKGALNGLNSYGKESIKEIGIKTLKIQEDERKRIAGDLHDTSVQNLTYLIHKAELCTKLVDIDGIRCKLELQSMSNTLKDVINDMRNTIYNLRPMSFDDIGLNVTIERALEKIQADTKTKIEYESSGNLESINKVIAITILRLIMEACNNSIKHSEASLIQVCLKENGKFLELIIKDDGKGFDTETLKDKNSFGLSLMKERVFLLSGVFKIKTGKNEGTEIYIKLPVEKEEEK